MIAYLVTFIPLFILAGWRDITIIPDTDAYTFHFLYGVPNEKPFYKINIEDRFENGFLLYEKFIHDVITNSPLYFNVINAFVLLFVIFCFFKRHSECAWLTLFLFITLRLCISELTTLRQSLALLTGLVGYEALVKKKDLLFVFLILIAMTFHSSAYFLFIYWFIFRIKPNHSFYFWSTILTLFSFFFFGYLLQSFVEVVDPKYYENSINNNMISLFGIMTALESASLFAIVLFLYTKNENKTLLDKQLLFFTFVYVLVSIMSIRLFILYRMLFYILPFIVIYISNLVYRIPDKQKRHVMTFIVLSYATFTFLLYYHFYPEYFNIYPYKFYGS